MRVAVTDATGLVGRRVVDALIEDRHSVVGLTYPGQKASGVKPWPKTDKTQRTVLADVECLIATGLQGLAAPDVTAALEADIIRKASAAGVKRIILLSTSGIYRPAVTVRGTASETTERRQPDQMDARDAAGAALEEATRAVAAEADITVIRSPMVLTTDNPECLAIISQLLETGRVDGLPDRLQGVDADDLASVLVSTLRAPHAIGHALNVAGPKAVLIEDALAEVQRLYALLTDFKPSTVNLRPEYRYAAPIVDGARARGVLPKRANTEIWVNLSQLVQRYVGDERAAGRLAPVAFSITPAKRALQERTKPLRGRVALVTGATDGIGRATALMLSRLGAKVVATGRNKAAGADLVALAKSDKRHAPIRFIAADLTSCKDMHALATKVAKAHAKLDILINNAGAAYSERTTTADGLEATFALNTLAPVVLTHLLMPQLQAAPVARVLNLNSNSHRQGRPDFEDLQSEKDYHPMAAYAVTKLYQAMLTRYMATTVEGSNVAIHMIHPGSVRTEIEMKNGLGLRADPSIGPQAQQRLNTQRDNRRRQMISPEEAAAHVVNLAMSDEFDGLNGLYLDCAERVRNFEGAPISDETRGLWNACMELAGLPDAVLTIEEA